MMTVPLLVSTNPDVRPNPTYLRPLGSTTVSKNESEAVNERRDQKNGRATAQWDGRIRRIISTGVDRDHSSMVDRGLRLTLQSSTKPNPTALQSNHNLPPKANALVFKPPDWYKRIGEGRVDRAADERISQRG